MILVVHHVDLEVFVGELGAEHSFQLDGADVARRDILHCVWRAGRLPSPRSAFRDLLGAEKTGKATA